MFGFKKKQCSICQSNDVINVGKPIGYLCKTHMLDSYKNNFLAHRGRKIIIPPTVPDKSISYQIETLASLRSYGLNAADIAPLEKLFEKLPRSECYVTKSQYETGDFLNLDFFVTANWKHKNPADAAVFILSALPAYMESGGIALPPVGDEDIVLYPLRS